MEFRTRVEASGRTATGLVVPAEVLEGLGAGRRPPVVVTIAGYTYRSTIGTMDGRAMVPLSAAHRTAAGVAAGDDVDVELVLDVQPRSVALPADLAAAIAADPAAGATLAGLAPSHRKEWVRWVEEAKRPQTRADRIARTVVALSQGRRSRT